MVIIDNPKEKEIRDIPEGHFINIIVEDNQDVGVYFVTEQVDNGMHLIKETTNEEHLVTFFGKEKGQTELYNIEGIDDTEQIGVIEGIQLLE